MAKIEDNLSGEVIQEQIRNSKAIWALRLVIDRKIEKGKYSDLVLIEMEKVFNNVKWFTRC